ncbi:MAG: hypothetical protein IJU70_12695 [Lentisphaeria bacterium]|nr:hypothetical protein [Lentisphaeria bacterium]
MKITSELINIPGGNAWFHPAFCRYGKGKLLLTFQKIHGPDHYGEPEFAVGGSPGQLFASPSPIPPFAPRQRENGLVEAVADIRPFDLGRGFAAVLGCTVFYCDKGSAQWLANDRFAELPKEEPVYALLRPDGSWSERMRLDVAGDFAGFRTACTQICRTQDGGWIIPFYAEKGRCECFGRTSARYFAITAKYRFDGDRFIFLEKGNALENSEGRGFCEPSVCARENGDFLLTLRAEDGHGYTTCSGNGLDWSPPRKWRWDDDSGITMSSTQQHWLKIGKKIYLVYTRRTEENREIFRFRTPLFMAEADPDRAVLKRRSETIVFQRRRLNGEDALYGNFHVTQLSDAHALIADSAFFSREKTALPVFADIRDNG